MCIYHRDAWLNRPPKKDPQVVPQYDSELDERDKDNATNSSHSSKSRSPLETQEILLFYTISLLQTMALDSAKVC